MTITRTIYKKEGGELCLEKTENLAFVRGAVVSEEVGAEVKELLDSEAKVKESEQKKVADEKAAEKAKKAKVAKTEAAKTESAPTAAQGN